jgi:hypothetical protein
LIALEQFVETKNQLSFARLDIKCSGEPNHIFVVRSLTST